MIMDVPVHTQQGADISDTSGIAYFFKRLCNTERQRGASHYVHQTSLPIFYTWPSRCGMISHKVFAVQASSRPKKFHDMRMEHWQWYCYICKRPPTPADLGILRIR